MKVNIASLLVGRKETLPGDLPPSQAPPNQNQLEVDQPQHSNGATNESPSTDPHDNPISDFIIMQSSFDCKL